MSGPENLRGSGRGLILTCCRFSMSGERTVLIWGRCCLLLEALVGDLGPRIPTLGLNPRRCCFHLSTWHLSLTWHFHVVSFQSVHPSEVGTVLPIS